MKRIIFVLVILALVSTGVAFAGDGAGHAWKEPAPNSGDGVPDGPGR